MNNKEIFSKKIINPAITKVNHLENEIDETFENMKITHKKLDQEELSTIINTLTKTFFKSESNLLNPTELNEKSTEYNPKFWREIQHRIHQKHLILLVYDSAYRAWEVGDAQDVASILHETTGYPFWVTDSEFTFLVHMDDHDCIHWA
ncbi:hypothetical protein DYL61_17510 [Pseudomonas nabeulensis]|uniref:Uncharacterized protein n=1 Tax=Pseudomonas nabeulensis TaxID=2293833 RepID=A0A4Z0B0P3_9PSED|nr:hypothetical protein [Pseudomonas nabeulensis]TFY92270.1 hypothetical protein DYL61_17510 [Pseudomonas nabeulensis]